ncbi:MAG: hypothetical protein ABFS21_07615 [Actinomycetota bacterium]
MSDSGDYPSEMIFKRNTDADIERLFDGRLDASSDLAPVSDLFETLRAEAAIEPGEISLAGFAQAAAEASTAVAREGAVAGSAVAVKRAGLGSLFPTFRRRVATAIAAAAVFVGSMSGMAVAADSSKPGDALYGLDRAFEAVGIGNGHAAERVAEAQDLVDAGELPRGLLHAAEIVKPRGPDDSAASTALSEAAERLSTVGSDQSAETRDRVAELLSYLASNARNADGHEVAQLAREIGRPAEPPGKSASPSDQQTASQGHGRAEPPGRSGLTPQPPISPGKRP